jgi:hypothetical protein
LTASLGYQPGFVTVNCAVGIILDFKNSFTTNGAFVSRGRNQTPSLISMKCLDFLLHGVSPFGVLKCLRKRERLSRNCHISSKYSVRGRKIGIRENIGKTMSLTWRKDLGRRV